MSLENQMSWKEIVEKTIDDLKKKNPKDFSEKKFREWFLTKEYMGVRTIDSPLVYRAFKTWERINNDYDSWTVIAGKEGEGKSSLGINYCSLISPNFSNEYVCIDADHFNEVFKKANKGDSILLDEGGALLFSRDAMSTSSKFIIKSAMVARARNVNIVVCIPNFFLIDTYIRDHRLNLLIQVLKRGKYKAIFGSAITMISAQARLSKNVASVKIPYRYFWEGDFRKEISQNFDYKLYLENKNKYITEFLNNEAKKPYEEGWVRSSNVAKQMNMQTQLMTKWIKEGKIEAKRIGRLWFIRRNIADNIIKNGVI